MLDIKYIRENIEKVKENTLKRKGKVDIDEILSLDDQRKQLVGKLENLRATINTGSKQKPSTEQIQSFRQLKGEIVSLEKDLKKVNEKLFEKMSWVPNISSPEMPEGESEEDNVEVKVWTPEEGYLDKLKLGKANNAALYMSKKEGLLHHQELGENLDILDNKQSALTSGSRFVYLKNEAVILQWAIQQLLTQKLLSKGFKPFIPPLLVREKVLFGTSHFPEGRDQVYNIESENVEEKTDLFLVGSSEPALFAYHMDKTLKEDDLPYKMFAMTSCFRSEVGSWGKDVRGIKRVHQFDKLEMDVVCTPEQSEEIFTELLEINEWLLQELKIPYRVINKCYGDCGYLASYKQYDVEAWLPGQKEFMEVMTDTNALDFQSRRLNIKGEKGGQKRLLHTVNDTGCAMGRMIIAILDNYQQKDGSVIVPDVLIPFTGFSQIKPK